MNAALPEGDGRAVPAKLVVLMVTVLGARFLHALAAPSSLLLEMESSLAPSNSGT